MMNSSTVEHHAIRPTGLHLSDGKLGLRKGWKTLKFGPDNVSDVLIRVLLSGICGTDLELVRGYYPYEGILGHEFVGEVAAVHPNVGDDVRKDWVGKRVVADIHAVCHECRRCRDGLITHCDKRKTLGIINKDGCHATYCMMPLDALHKVPDSVPNEAAVFSEPLAAALNITQRIHIGPETQVLVIGAGRLGQLCSWVLALTGCDLRVCARSSQQKDMLRKRAIALVSEDEVKFLPDEFDVVVECTGNSEAFPLAITCVKPRGSIVLKSTYAGNTEVNLSAVVVKEVALIGNRCGSSPGALRLLASKAVDPTDLIQEIVPLSRAVEAMDLAAKKGAMKILLEPDMRD